MRRCSCLPIVLVVLLGCGPGQSVVAGDETGGASDECDTPGMVIWTVARPEVMGLDVVGVLANDALLVSGRSGEQWLIERWSAEGELEWSLTDPAWLEDGAVRSLITVEAQPLALVLSSDRIRMLRLDPADGELAWELELANEQPEKWTGRLAGRGSTLAVGLESIDGGNTELRDWHVLRIDMDADAVVWEQRPTIPGNRMDTLTLAPNGDVLVTGALNDYATEPEAFLRFAAADGAESWFRPREDDLYIAQLAWFEDELHALLRSADAILVFSEAGELLRTIPLATVPGTSPGALQIDPDGRMFMGAWVLDAEAPQGVAGDLFVFEPDGSLRWRLSEIVDDAMTCPLPQLDASGHVLCAVQNWTLDEAALVKQCR